MLYIGTTGHFGCFGEAELERGESGSLGRRLEAIGAPGVEVFMDSPIWRSLPDGSRVARRVLDGYAGRLSLHAPFWDLNLAAYRPEVRALAVERLREALAVAAELGADHLVVHPYASATPDLDGRRDEHAAESLLVLTVEAAARGVLLAVENMTDSTRSPDSPGRFLALIDHLPRSACALLDLGHAHASGWDIPAVISRIGDRLGAVHIHDNHGQADEHLPVGKGTIPWVSVWPALRAAPDSCHWVTEYLGVGEDLLHEHIPLLLAERAAPTPR